MKTARSGHGFGTVLGLVCGVALAVSSSGFARADGTYSSWFSSGVTWYHQGSGPSSGAPSGHTICYNAHLANVGWQGWKCDGQSAGDGVHQIEAVAFTAEHYPDFFYMQAHLAYVGWTTVPVPVLIPQGYGSPASDWIGTTGQSRRLEALALMDMASGYLIGLPICGQANVLGQGWGAVQYAEKTSTTLAIMTLGTWGLARPLMYFWIKENAC